MSSRIGRAEPYLDPIPLPFVQPVLAVRKRIHFPVRLRGRGRVYQPHLDKGGRHLIDLSCVGQIDLAPLNIATPGKGKRKLAGSERILHQVRSGAMEFHVGQSCPRGVHTQSCGKRGAAQVVNQCLSIVDLAGGKCVEVLVDDPRGIDQGRVAVMDVDRTALDALAALCLLHPDLQVIRTADRDLADCRR